MSKISWLRDVTNNGTFCNQDKGMKFDGGKPRWSLMPWTEMEEVVRVMTAGAKKYSDFNWQQTIMEPGGKDRYFSAAIRHLTAWKRGERLDRETGLPHLAHAICCLLFMGWADNKERSW